MKLRSILTVLLLALSLLLVFSLMKQGDPASQTTALADAYRIPLISNHINDSVLLVHASVNNQDGLFVVDTGASHSVLSQQFSAKLGLKRSSIPKGHETNVTTELDTAQVNQIRLGSAAFHKFNVIVVDLSHLNQHQDEPLVGIIGMDLLRQITAFTIDYENRLLTVNPRERNGQIAPIILSDAGILSTDLVVDGESIKMQIDTGASNTIVDSKTWETLKRSRTIREKTSVQANINGTSKKTIPFISIRELAMGDISVTDLAVESGNDNLLGMNLFKRFVVTFSFQKKRMYLQRYKAGQPPYLPMTALPNTSLKKQIPSSQKFTLSPLTH